MHLIKQISFLISAALITINCSASVRLEYQQEVTLSTFDSEETKKLVDAFCQAAKGDPDIKVINIKYTQKIVDPTMTWCDAILECYVSTPDEDVLRIQGKMLQNMNKPKAAP